MQKYSKSNFGFRYCLNIIDVFSKYLYSIPIKDKSGESIAIELSDLVKENITKVARNLLNHKPPTFKKNDSVRIAIRSTDEYKQNAFSKPKETYSRNIFKIKHIISDNNGLSYPKYLLSNNRIYSPYDLLFVNENNLIRNVNISRLSEEINPFTNKEINIEKPKSKQIEIRPKSIRSKWIPKKYDIYEVDKYSKK
jgi:hypothetical protein